MTGSSSLDLLVSGRFRKVSGSLSGSLHLFHSIIAIPEDSGRFAEACPEASLNTSVYCIPEDSGRLPEDLTEGVQNTKPWF